MSLPVSAVGTRVGWGFDSHPLNDQPPLILGGIEVSDRLGVAATSDGDVLAHAITDALLGACALADIGEHFPSDDPGSRGADSLLILSEAAGMAAAAGWQVTHVDSTIVVEEIRISPHRESMRSKVGAALGIDASSVSVKATTTDGLGFIGRGEGLAAVAVVTVSALP